MKNHPFILAALLVLAAPIYRSHAALYWDPNGTTAGAGTTPAGTWDTAITNWNTDPLGITAPGLWTSGESAVFSAGSDATGAYTVTVSGTQTASGIVVEEGTVTLATGVVALGTGSVTVGLGATLVTDSSARITASVGSVWTLNGGTLRTTNTGGAGSFITSNAVIVLGPAGGTFSYTTANVLNIVQFVAPNPGTVISGTGSLTKTGVGVLAIATTSTYTGPTFINDGELRIRGAADRLPITTAVTVTSPGILNLNGVNQRIGSLTGNGAVGLANALLTVGDATNTTFTGVIGDTKNAGAGGATSVGGKVTKVGTGTLSLSGTNIYTGLTTVSEGTLALTGATSSIGTGGLTVLGTAVKLDLQTGVLNGISDTATVTLAGGGTAALADFGYLQLGAGVNEVAGTLILGGLIQPIGTYGSSASSALFKNDEYFSGTGTLTVTTVPEPGAAVMLLGGFGVLAGWHRMRRLN